MQTQGAMSLKKSIMSRAPAQVTNEFSKITMQITISVTTIEIISFDIWYQRKIQK